MTAREELRSSLFSVKQLSEKIMIKDLSPVDLIEDCLERIKELNPKLNAFITVIEEGKIYKEAQIAEKEIKQGNYRGFLHGIPFSIKDIIYAKGVRFTAGSKILSNYISNVNATVVDKMKKAGAILIGTNNLNEFASGITGINPFYGSSKNPWDNSRISGGSSSGSAVAVATGMIPIALGTDTGGSIRVPASLCGVVGLKPTYGRISKHNVFPLSPSLDHVGCITRSVWDAAAVIEYIAGWDQLDETSEDKKVPIYTKIIEEKSSPKEGIRIGIPKDYFFEYLHPGIKDLFYDFIDTLRLIDSIVVCDDLDLSNTTEKYHRSWRDIRLAETSEIHLKWLNSKTKDNYSLEVRNMLIEGTKITAVGYLTALRIIKEIRKEFLSILNHKADVLIVPTTIVPAPRFNEETISIKDKVLQTREALLRNTIVFNSTGLPAVNIPIGLTRDKDNMPAGAQIIGSPFREDLILSVGYKFERINNSINKFIPPLGNVKRNK
ncbi:MAG TPA: amidase [Nitrososphaeraceae archaeon]|nr:amidase [Nitrososphaeraceae archaeon]